MLNGSPLTREGLFKIRNYTIPDTGTLRLDYVTYKVRGGGDRLTIQRVGVAGWSAALWVALHLQLHVGMGWQARGGLHIAVQGSLCSDATMLTASSGMSVAVATRCHPPPSSKQLAADVNVASLLPTRKS